MSHKGRCFRDRRKRIRREKLRKQKRAELRRLWELSAGMAQVRQVLTFGPNLITDATKAMFAVLNQARG